MTLDQYLVNKHEAEKRNSGYSEYASIEIRHTYFGCRCNGANPSCRVTTKREWRKTAQTKEEVN